MHFYIYSFYEIEQIFDNDCIDLNNFIASLEVIEFGMLITELI